MARFDGKVAFITGAARGQGRAIAERFASEGANIVACDVCAPLETMRYKPSTEADLAETKRAVEQLGRNCIAEVVDVRDLAGLTDLAARAVVDFGRIDVACANAGLVGWVKFEDLTEGEWREMVDVNLTGAFFTAKAVAPTMMAQRSGSIVLTASVNGREPGKGLTHYTAAKHGVIGLMRSLALELGPHHIRVNAVLPSVINTPMTNNTLNAEWIFGRPDATEEDFLVATRNWHVLRNLPAMPPKVVAAAVSWLASDEAAYVTGIELPVDGGHCILPGFNHDAVVEELDGAFRRLDGAQVVAE